MNLCQMKGCGNMIEGDKGLCDKCITYLSTNNFSTSPKKVVNFRTEVLNDANDIINGDRQEAYGDVHDSFASIAAVWTWYLEAPITAKDVAQMMTLLKISREKMGDSNIDNFIDAIGYQALAAEISN